MNRTGIQWEYLPHDFPPVKTVLPRRWVLERSLGWLMLHRRLTRDYETLPERSQTMIHWAMIDSMSRTLTGENTQTWRAPIPETGQTSFWTHQVST